MSNDSTHFSLDKVDPTQNMGTGIVKNDQLNSIESIVESIKTLGYPNCSERISFLNSTDDLEEGEKPLDLESAKGFLNFFRKFQALGEPLLGLFPEGTLSVGWRIADHKHLLVEPLDSRNVSFAMICPSDSNPSEKFRLNARGKIEDVIRTLRERKVDQWISS